MILQYQVRPADGEGGSRGVYVTSRPTRRLAAAMVCSRPDRCTTTSPARDHSMKIALYQEFGEGCRRLTHELLPATTGWELLDVPHAGADIASLAAEDAETIRSAEVVIASPLSPFPDAVYDPHGQVRLIQLLSAGYDKVDLDRCRAAGQLVATNGGANAVAVAEHTVMFILTVLRRLPVLDRDMRAGRWTAAKTPEWEPHELEGRTVGLVGMGRIGREVARRLRPFDVQLQYYDVVPAPSEVTDSLQVRYVSWSRLLETSDIISLHVPLMESTRGLIGAAELAQMKSDAILINTARGGSDRRGGARRRAGKRAVGRRRSGCVQCRTVPGGASAGSIRSGRADAALPPGQPTKAGPSASGLPTRTSRGWNARSVPNRSYPSWPISLSALRGRRRYDYGYARPRSGIAPAGVGRILSAQSYPETGPLRLNPAGRLSAR